MRLLPLVCGWLATASVLPGQSPSPGTPDARPRVILFVGNSFTYGGATAVHGYNAGAVIDENADQEPMGGIPGIFKKLADEAGRPYEVHVELVGGKDLEYHYDHSLPLIASGKWDSVVLQGYSTEALPEKRGGKPANFVRYAGLLEKAIHEANPRTRIFLYQTWPRADMIYPENATYHEVEGLEKMTWDLHLGYDEAGHPSQVIRVGEGWERAIRDGVAQANPYLPPEPGRLNLWAQDYYHPSIYGSYLAALCLFGNIAVIDVTTMNPQEVAASELGISWADAERLRRAARVNVEDQRSPVPPEGSRRTD